jgi:REP element-mobilizing transposase RayT
MANTYTQLYLQIVFAVKGRRSLIPKEYKWQIHNYIHGIINKRGHTMIAIHCMPDHIHILLSYNLNQKISDLVKEIKVASNKYINQQRWVRSKFDWQNGFGAFTYSKSHIDNVKKYILNQESHHKQVKFKTEYKSFLEKYDIEYDEKYLFEFYD